MPYISKEQREDVKAHGPTFVGELNYALSQVVNDYMSVSKYNYQSFNDVVGALECLKMEIYRRFISGYEDYARVRNGEVFTFQHQQMKKDELED